MNKKHSILILFIFIFGCATNTALIDNSIKKLKVDSFSEKDYKKLEVKDSDRNSLLYSQEIGRIAFIKGDTQKSIEELNKVRTFYNIQDEKSKLANLSSTALASTYGNDNAIPYKGSDYERVYANFYLALNYLKNEELEKSLVAIRATADSQRFAIAKRENVIYDSESKISSYELSKDAKDYLAEARKIRSQTKGRFLNPYVYYISGNIREINGDLNGALVDYKNAFEIAPNNPYIIEDLLRLSSFMDRSYYDYTKKIIKTSYKDENQSDYSKSKTILVIYEQGFVPQKTESGGTIIILGVVARLSLPQYKLPQESLNNMQVNIINNDKILDYSYGREVVNNYNLAKNDLAEQYNDIILRTITRLTTKVSSQIALQSSSNSDLALISSLALGIATSVAENADLRSFRTLPSYVQVAKISTKEDITDINLIIRGQVRNFDNLSIKNGEIAIIHIVDANPFMYYNILYSGKKYN